MKLEGYQWPILTDDNNKENGKKISVHLDGYKHKREIEKIEITLHSNALPFN